MRFLITILLCCLAIFAQTLRADEPAAEEQKTLNILFIGNSFTYSNDLPRMIQGLANSRGRKIEVEMQAPGGCTLEKHWQDGKAAELIKSKQWDYVVLQEHSDGPINNLKGMKEFAGKFDELIKKQGAKTVLFMTWARQDKAPTQRKITTGYEETAKELGATLVPVGLAWQKATSGNKSLTLHSADKHHPNEQGSYLAACVFFSMLVDPKNDGLPGNLVFNGKTLANITDGDARRLQRFAREAIREEKGKQEAAAEKEKKKEEGKPAEEGKKKEKDKK
jgi:hypothetical protein